MTVDSSPSKADLPAPRSSAAYLLAVLAPVVVVGTVMESGRFVALGAYVSGLALVVALFSRRAGTAGAFPIWCSAIALIAGLASLAFGIALMGWGTLVFSGSG